MSVNESIKEIELFLPERYAGILVEILRENTQVNEIRIRKNMPVIVSTPLQSFFIAKEKMARVFTPDVLCTDESEMALIFSKLCHYSVYSYKESLNSGYITLNSGSRVGVCAQAVVKNGEVCSLKNISSLCFRIARQVKTCALQALAFLHAQGMPSAIIIGAPCSGKTTLLRDICKNLSSGYQSHLYKCALIDERGELAAMQGGNAAFNVGYNTDVLSFFPKHIGILNALRTLSPEVIIADEIGTVRECESVLQGLNSGVKFFVSLHAASIAQAQKKEQFRLLVNSGNFGAVISLGSGEEFGKITGMEKI